METCNSPAVPRRNRLAIVELLAIVALAAGIGTATGIVLGGAVLLFSAGDSPIITEAAALHAASLPRI